MIEFWLCAGLLLLAALAFLLIPVLRARKVQAEEDRTALNVTLYQERLQELQAQHAAGALNEQQLASGQRCVFNHETLRQAGGCGNRPLRRHCAIDAGNRSLRWLLGRPHSLVDNSTEHRHKADEHHGP